MKSNKEVLEEVHNILADFYDEELERNQNNAKRNVSRTIRILRERIEEIKI
jgi:transcription initiation factor IIE alpha subunit